MSERNDNPFAVPHSLTTAANAQENAAEARLLLGKWVLRGGSLVAFVLFAGFTSMLLTGGRADRSAGYAFLCNAVLLLALTITSWTSIQAAFFFGCSAVAVQIVITLLLLSTGGNPYRTVVINGIIVLPIHLLTLLAHRIAKHRHKHSGH